MSRPWAPAIRVVEAVSTGPTTHRGTFATAVPQWKSWFDGR